MLCVFYFTTIFLKSHLEKKTINTLLKKGTNPESVVEKTKGAKQEPQSGDTLCSFNTAQTHWGGLKTLISWLSAPSIWSVGLSSSRL
jgi:hypothetical protein